MADDITSMDAVRTPWLAAGGDHRDLAHLAIEGNDPIYPSPFRVGTLAAASVAGAALAAAKVWQVRTGRWQIGRA
ncbi:MAG: CoA transferase, partial [Dehalococcoidia bacterium]